MIVDFSVLGVRGDWQGPYTILDATGKRVCCDAYLVDTVTGECKMLAYDRWGNLVRNSQGLPFSATYTYPAPLKVLDRHGKKVAEFTEKEALPETEANRSLWIGASHGSNPTDCCIGVDKAQARNFTSRVKVENGIHNSIWEVTANYGLTSPSQVLPPQEPAEDEVSPCLVVVANG